MATLETSQANLSAEQQLFHVWSKLQKRNESTAEEAKEWPSYDILMKDIHGADYNHTLTCPFDFGKENSSKSLCPHGVICCAKVHIFERAEGTMYTGLLQPGKKLDNCMIRLSSAIRPPSQDIKSTWARALLYATGEKIRNAKLFPCAGLKIFRRGIRSGNLLFSGSKVGQREADYFAHCQATSMTEQMPRAIKPFVRKFWQYSDYPLSLGVSDFCEFDEEGVAHSETVFPFAVILRPRVKLETHENREADDDSFDTFLERTLAIPEGTHLFDIFTCEDPNHVSDPMKLQRIGTITTSSPFIRSSPRDGIFFRHQKKEEDYDLKPEWKQALQNEVSIDDGRTKGTIGKLAGWKLFEQQIAKGVFQDFEKED